MQKQLILHSSVDSAQQQLHLPPVPLLILEVREQRIFC